MGQVLHGCATTTEAIRRAIQNSQESLRAISKRYGINQKTVAKWKKRNAVGDLPTGPKDTKSSVLSVEDEAIIVAFRRHTLLPRERHRAPANQNQAPVDERPGRTNEPDDQGSHRQAVSLRQPPAAPEPSFRFHQCLQLRMAAQDPQGPHSVRIHLQDLDKRARTIHPRSNPSNAGTKQLEQSSCG